MLIQLLVILGLSISISFLCSILEAVILSVTQGYVQVLKEEREKAGLRLERIQQQIDEPIAAILTLNTVAHTFGAALGGSLALQIFGSGWMAAFSAALTLAILLFSEILPKTLGATLWPQLAPISATVLRGLIFLTKPVVIPLSLFARLITPGQERPSTVSRREIEALARIGQKEGAIEEDEFTVVRKVMQLDEVEIDEVMTPRTDMVAAPVESSVEEAMGVMLDKGHLRLPVYEGSLDKVVGILLARDLWRAHRDGVEHIEEVMRSPQFAPASKPVDDLIREMRGERLKMVIVVDEFGGTAGLVTLEDLLEEIVGEIQDEHEEDEPIHFQTLESGDVRVWGGALLRDMAEALELDLPEDQYDTAAGFLFSSLNRIPRVGDAVTIEGGTLLVQRMRGRRVEYLLFKPES
jgi:putative hemolysin